MKAYVYLGFIAISALMAGCAETVYKVKSFKYYDETLVDVEVIDKNETKHLFCAFPPNTDFALLKKVKLGAIKSQDERKGPIYYCEIVP